jgi:hypothetical protein
MQKVVGRLPADKLLPAIRTHCAIDKAQAELLSQAMEQLPSQLAPMAVF